MADQNTGLLSEEETIVKTIVTEFIARNELFTALDVSNKVKEKLPKVRHRDISPIVRNMYRNGEMGNYERTNITVKLIDGDSTANLYHPIGDTWDLDSKYDDTKRSQTAVRPVQNPVAAEVEKAFVAEVSAGLSDIESGNTYTHAQVMEDLKAKYNAPIKVEAPQLPPSMWDGVFAKARKKLFGG